MGGSSSQNNNINTQINLLTPDDFQQVPHIHYFNHQMHQPNQEQTEQCDNQAQQDYEEQIYRMERQINQIKQEKSHLLYELQNQIDRVNYHVETQIYQDIYQSELERDAKIYLLKQKIYDIENDRDRFVSQLQNEIEQRSYKLAQEINTEIYQLESQIYKLERDKYSEINIMEYQNDKIEREKEDLIYYHKHALDQLSYQIENEIYQKKNETEKKIYQLGNDMKYQVYQKETEIDRQIYQMVNQLNALEFQNFNKNVSMIKTLKTEIKNLKQKKQQQITQIQQDFRRQMQDINDQYEEFEHQRKNFIQAQTLDSSQEIERITEEKNSRLKETNENIQNIERAINKKKHKIDKLSYKKERNDDEQINSMIDEIQQIKNEKNGEIKKINKQIQHLINQFEEHFQELRNKDYKEIDELNRKIQIVKMEKNQQIKEMKQMIQNIQQQINEEQTHLYHHQQGTINKTKIKRKHIKLNKVDFIIVDVPRQILLTLKKCYNVSPNFSMSRASTFIKMVLNHGQIPDDFHHRLVLASCDQNTQLSDSFESDNKLALLHLFKGHSSTEIDVAIQHTQNFLLNTVPFLKTNEKINNIKNESNGRIFLSRVIINDPLVSVQLDELFAEHEKEEKKKKIKEEEERQIREAEIEGRMIECTCCICEYPIEWMISCPKGHMMCKKCVEKQIETLIAEGRSNVKCLKYGGDCQCEISMKELEEHIPKKTLKRLIQTETINVITSAHLENTVKCHKCGYIVIFEEENEVNGPMNCPVCKAQTCAKCGQAWHDGMTCEQFKDVDKERLVEEQMNEAVVRTCPTCKTQFVKDEGCNKMECPRCHTWICYWCRKVIPKEVGYGHFWRENGPCPPDKCPLWVENDTLHMAEAVNAKDNAREDLDII